MKFAPVATVFALLALIAFSAPAGAENGLIAAGGYHTCALAANGTVRCWGDNSSAELGVGTITQRLAPVQVAGLGGGIQAVAAKGAYTCALTSMGAVRCWGDNSHGQLGDGTTIQRRTPVTVTGLGSGVRAIAAANLHTCALTAAGAVLCWGDNRYGQLGDGTTTQRLTPVAVAGLGSGVNAIAAGGDHACAVTTAGAVFCWGDNIAGQLGDGTRAQRDTPVLVSGLGSGVQAIALGYYHSCALSTGGAVSCWGYNAVGALGDGSTGDANHDRLTPVPVTGLGSGVHGIAAGYEHTCATTAAGAVLCWGWNVRGQLGDNTTTNRLTPVPVAGLSSGVQALAGGVYHTCALATAGAVYCWGANNAMQLGDGTTTDRLTPVSVLFRSALNTADFNGDGFSDILWRNITTGANTIWKSANPTLPQTMTSVTDQAWEIVGTGDFNADGVADILWHNTHTGASVIWKSAKAPTTQAVSRVTNLDWQIVGVGDFDGDGYADILWRDVGTGANIIWRSGNATTTQAVTRVTDVNWHVVAVGDFNSDGRSDIFWRNTNTGANAIWYSGRSTTTQSVMGVTDLNWGVAGVGDFDGDGAADVLWHNQSTGASVIWKSGNSSTQQAVTRITDLQWTIVATGDYNGDGKSDLLWRHSGSGANAIWLSAHSATPQSVRTVADSSWKIIGK
jgi:alpha-tubulin suppressor-like RCC1 family protein